MYQAIHLGLSAEGSRELNLVIDIKSLILRNLAFFFLMVSTHIKNLEREKSEKRHTAEHG